MTEIQPRYTGTNDNGERFHTDDFQEACEKCNGQFVDTYTHQYIAPHHNKYERILTPAQISKLGPDWRQRLDNMITTATHSYKRHGTLGDMILSTLRQGRSYSARDMFDLFVKKYPDKEMDYQKLRVVLWRLARSGRIRHIRRGVYRL